MPFRLRRSKKSQSQPQPDPKPPQPVTPVIGGRLTTDRNDPRLGTGVDTKPIPQHEVYLVLSDEERAKGFVQPVRRTYVHVGPPGPKYPLRDLTPEEQERWNSGNREPYVKYEPYPPDSGENGLGSLWTQARLDKIGKGCGVETTMGQVLAETYARDPNFYGATYCCGCQMHLKVGRDGEFVWVENGRQTDLRVGT